MAYSDRIEVPTKNVRDIARVFGYKKRKVWIEPCESVTLRGTNWSGGSRSVYTPMNLADLRVDSRKADEFGRHAPWNNPYDGAEVPLSNGLAMVRTGHFCGRESQMVIYVHPSNMPALLPS